MAITGITNDILAKCYALKSSTCKCFARCPWLLQMTSWQNTILSDLQIANPCEVSQGVLGYSGWHLGNMPCSQIIGMLIYSKQCTGTSGADEFEKCQVRGRSTTKKRAALHLFSIVFTAGFLIGPSPRFLFLLVCYFQLAHAYEVSEGVLGYSKWHFGKMPCSQIVWILMYSKQCAGTSTDDLDKGQVRGRSISKDSISFKSIKMV